MPQIPRDRRNRRALACRGVALPVNSFLFVAFLAGSVYADPYLGSRIPKPPPPPTWMEPGEQIPIEGPGWTPVVALLENGEARVRRAWHNVATAQQLLTKARIRRYPRGEPLFAIRDRVIFLEAERGSAEKEFIMLVEQARRGGMPAGTLSSFMDFSGQILRDRAGRTPSP